MSLDESKTWAGAQAPVSARLLPCPDREAKSIGIDCARAIGGGRR